jgi:calcium-dependent protein kinase
VILFILLCGYPPFNGPSDKHIISAVIKGEYSIDEPEWADVSAEAKDLVKKLLTMNPSVRPSALDAYNHPWIKKMASGDRVDKKVAIKTL